MDGADDGEVDRWRRRLRRGMDGKDDGENGQMEKTMGR